MDFHVRSLSTCSLKALTQASALSSCEGSWSWRMVPYMAVFTFRLPESGMTRSALFHLGPEKRTEDSGEVSSKKQPVPILRRARPHTEKSI